MIATFDYNPKIPKRKNTGVLGSLGNKETNVRYHGYYVPYELGTGVLKKKKKWRINWGFGGLFSTVHQLLDL
jgi:hypothetical protein